MKRRFLGLASLAGLAALTLWPIGDAGRLAAVDEAPSVAVFPTTQLSDGQAVAVTIKTTADAPVYRAIVQLCRAGVSYQPSSTDFPNRDVQTDGHNCPGPSHAVSSSSDPYVSDSNTFTDAQTPDGAHILFRVGSGVTAWTDNTTGDPVSLTCDQKNPCALVVSLQYDVAKGGPTQWKPFVFTVTYGNNDPIAGCGGAAQDALQTGGSDRMQDAWVSWTIGTCAAHPEVHAPSRASFVGEGVAVTSFSNGALDLAYTAGGYDKDMGLIPPNAVRRDSVAIPIALNAAVMGVGGGIISSGHKAPYHEIKTTAAELASMISGGARGVTEASPDSTPSSPRTYEDDIKDRNPELKQTGLFDNSGGFVVAGYADAEAFSWYATRYFKQFASTAWRVPDISTFGENRGKPRTIDAALALAQPPFPPDVLPLKSGRPEVRKGLVGPGPTTAGGIWVLTDLETARTFNLTPVSVADAKGNFVAPTPEALVAAVSLMKPNDQGILISDPTKTGAAGAAYPMTMVEYALVPTQPLLNDDCTARTQAQKMLTDWLTYITGEGQTKLPPGMVPLPQSLRDEAATSIAKVGASAITGRCAVAEGQPPTIAAPSVDQPVAAPAPAIELPSVPSIATGSAPLASAYSQPPLLNSAPAASEPLASGGSADAAPLQNQKIASIPAFAGRRSSGWIMPVLGLVGIMTLSTLALYASAKPK